MKKSKPIDIPKAKSKSRKRKSKSRKKKNRKKSISVVRFEEEAVVIHEVVDEVKHECCMCKNKFTCMHLCDCFKQSHVTKVDNKLRVKMGYYCTKNCYYKTPVGSWFQW